MSKISKYFISTDVSNFTKVYDFNIDWVRTNPTRGIWNSSESSHYQWRTTVNCFLNDVLIQVETLTGVGRIIYDITLMRTSFKKQLKFQLE